MVTNFKAKFLTAWAGMPRYVYALAAVAVLGLSAGVYRLYAGLGATTNLNSSFPWGVWISFDLTTVAFAGGAFTLATLVYVLHRHDLHAAVRPTVLLGLLGYSSVLVILLFDLGRWDRFWHFLVYPNLTSALFEVSWCIAIYTTILAFEFSPVLLERFRNPRLLALVNKLTIPLVIAGITLSSMHQSSLGALFVIAQPRVHPLWYSALQPEFFLLSSLGAGIATVLLGAFVSIRLFGQTLSQAVVEKLGRFMPWFLGAYLALKLGELAFTGEFGLLFTSGWLSVLYAAELLIGAAIPLVLFSLKRVRTSRSASVVAAVFVAAGIILTRFDMSWFALRPVNGLTYFPSWIELALLVGVGAGVLLVFTLLSHFLPVFAETVPVPMLVATSEASQPVVAAAEAS